MQERLLELCGILGEDSVLIDKALAAQNDATDESD